MKIKVIDQDTNHPQVRFVKAGKPLKCLPHARSNFQALRIKSTKPHFSEFVGKEIERVVVVSKYKINEQQYIPICEIQEFPNGQKSTDFTSCEISRTLKGEFDVEAGDENYNISLSNLRFVSGSQLRISRDLIPPLTFDVNPSDIENIKESSGGLLFLASFSGEDELWPLCAFDKERDEAAPEKSKDLKPPDPPVDKIGSNLTENMAFLEMLNILEANPKDFEDDHEEDNINFLKTVPIQKHTTRSRVYKLISSHPGEICSYALAANKSLIEIDDPIKTKIRRTNGRKRWRY